MLPSEPDPPASAVASRTANLSALFHPQSAAVLGVSDVPTKLGNKVLRNLIHGGFAGRIFPIGRIEGTVDGIKCYRSLEELPGPVDIAFLAVPATSAVEMLRQCANAGVKVAVVGSAGFSEDADPEGIARQQSLAQIVAETGIRVVGPNCNGVYMTGSKLALGFNTAHGRKLPGGAIALLSHSGALFDSMMRVLEPMGGGISAFVSAGNQVDLDVLDCMEYLLDDPGTRVFALLLDSIPDGVRFRRLSHAARQRGKAVVVLKIGVSDVGSQAATAHSSRLTGSAAAYAALLADSGVAMASTLEGFITAAVMLERFGFVGGGIGVLTSSGAGASLIADIADRHGIRVPEYTAQTMDAISPFQRFSQLANPTDMGVFGNMDNAEQIYPAIAADAGVGVFLAQIHDFPGKPGEKVAESVAAARRSTGKPTIVLVPGNLPAEIVSRYTRNDVPVFTDSDSCLQGIAAMLTPPPTEIDSRYGKDPECPAALLGREGALSEPESLSLLAEFGVSVVQAVVCRSEEEAVAAARRIGWPVVLKGIVEGVAHKSDQGLVHIDLPDEDAVRGAYRKLGANMEVLVQPMISGGVEAIAGVTRARDVGPILLAGLGGIYAEALRDVTIWSIPVARCDIERKLGCSALGRLLSGTRWRHPEAGAAFVDNLMGLQRFALAAGDAIEAVDINPIVLGTDGAVGVDALVVAKRAIPG
jgi:acyl-CoA synthetase (NDP forming)